FEEPSGRLHVPGAGFAIREHGPRALPRRAGVPHRRRRVLGRAPTACRLRPAHRALSRGGAERAGGGTLEADRGDAVCAVRRRARDGTAVDVELDDEQRTLRHRGLLQAFRRLLVVELAMARLWMSWGVQPAAMIG